MSEQSEPAHAGEQLRELRERAGMTVEEAAARAGLSSAHWAEIEAHGTAGFGYAEIVELVKATQPPRPDWWDEGHEHDLSLGEQGHLSPKTERQRAYWGRIEAVRAEIRKHYARGRRASG